MAKKEKAEIVPVAPTVTDIDVNEIVQEGLEIMQMTPADQLRHLQEEMGLQPHEVDVIATGKLPFWPAYAGGTLIGKLVARREVQTEYRSERNPEGKVGVYTVQLEKPALGATAEGERFNLKPGDCITLLEREVIKSLRERIGQRIGVLCMGKVEGATNTYYDYKILAQSRPSVSAVSQAE